MRPLRPIALLLCAALAACSDTDDLGRVLDEGPIQGQLLDDHHHEDEDCDEEHGEEEDCDEGHEEAPAGEPQEQSAAPGAIPPAPVALAHEVAPAPTPVETVAAPAASVSTLPAAATSPSAPVAGPAPPSGRFERASYTWIDFDPLMDFEYPELVRVDGDVPPPALPAAVLALNGKRVAVEGFMSPLAFDAGGVKEFSLVQDPSLCCFGAVPEMNHWIHVVMPDKERTEFYSFDPVAVYGVLQVGEEYQDGYVVSLYRMVADKVEGDF